MKLHRTTLRGLVKALDALAELEPQQRKLIAIVASQRGGIISREAVAEELWRGTKGGPEDCRTVISQQVSVLRKRSVPFVTHWGRGLSMGGGAA